MSEADVKIHSRDYWVKVVEMLQQNWALIDQESHGKAVVYFVHDGSGGAKSNGSRSLIHAFSGSVAQR